ncbi:hypothetical protein D9M73_119150 [compost metagenome]
MGLTTSRQLRDDLKHACIDRSLQLLRREAGGSEIPLGGRLDAAARGKLYPWAQPQPRQARAVDRGYVKILDKLDHRRAAIGKLEAFGERVVFATLRTAVGKVEKQRTVGIAADPGIETRARQRIEIVALICLKLDTVRAQDRAVQADIDLVLLGAEHRRAQ